MLLHNNNGICLQCHKGRQLDIRQQNQNNSRQPEDIDHHMNTLYMELARLQQP